MKKNNLKVIIFYAVVVAAILFAVVGIINSEKTEGKSFSEVVFYFETQQVSEFEVDNSNVLILKLRDGSIIKYKLSTISLNMLFFGSYADMIEEQIASGVIKQCDFEPASNASFWLNIIPYAVVILLFVVFWLFFINQTTGRGGKIAAFGRAKTKQATDDKKISETVERAYSERSKL